MRLPPLAVAALVASLPLCALGAEQGEEKAAKGDAHLRGLEIMVRPGMGAASGDSPVQMKQGARFVGDPGVLLQGASPYGVGFVGNAFLGYRFHPLVSGGFRGGLRSASASTLADGSTNLARSSWDAGFYVRGYPLALTEPLRRYFDPWISLGVEYMRDTQTFQRPVATSLGTTVPADWTLDHHAVAVPMGLGIDVRLHPMISLGPSFEYTIAAPVAGCAGVSASGFASNQICSNGDSGKNVIAANTYGVWSVSVDLRATLF